MNHRSDSQHFKILDHRSDLRPAQLSLSNPQQLARCVRRRRGGARAGSWIIWSNYKGREAPAVHMFS
jgi:hypothetical protein